VREKKSSITGKTDYFVEEQIALNIGRPSVREKTVINQPKELVRIDALKGKKHVSSSKVNDLSTVEIVLNNLSPFCFNNSRWKKR
jgi:hypothetical protein